MCLRFVFLLIMRASSWLQLSRREEAWKTAEILILRPDRRPATAAATPPEPGLGGPGIARDPARGDTERPVACQNSRRASDLGIYSRDS